MTGALLQRQRQIAAKVESVEGTAETLANTDAAMTIYDPTVVDDIAVFERNPARATLSQLVKIPGIKRRNFSFAMDIKGSGAIGTAPSWGKLLRACGFGEYAVSKLTVGAISTGPFQDGETITGGTSAATAKVVKQTANGVTTLFIRSITGTFSAGSETITGGRSGATATETGGATATQGFAYVLSSLTSDVISLTMGSYEDGKRKLGLGARGNVKLSLKDGEPGRFMFDFASVYSSTTDVALLSGITYETPVPVPYLSPALVLGSFSPIFSGLDLDMKNTLAMRQNANSANGILSAMITDRNPGGTIDPEAELVGTKDFLAELIAPTISYFETTIGSASGNKITLISPAMQIVKVEDGSRDKLALDKLEVAFVTPAASNTGDDEFTILAQ